MNAVNERVFLPILEENKLQLYIKRLDNAHLPVAGNKFYKLKYNLLEAKKNNFNSLLTFGGAYSNHILATALAGKEHDLKTIGLIRGEELLDNWESNPTLKAAYLAGMRFKFISRAEYRHKNEADFTSVLKKELGDFYLLPEGGTNALAVKGCSEILDEDDYRFDTICCAVGTGGTLAGLVNSSIENQRVLGFTSLKGDFLKEDICNFTARKNWELCGEYHFGGYAKVDEELIEFINIFKIQTQIGLDPVYTGKMMFGILDMAKKGFFAPGTTILAIHSGGIQGINGMNAKLKKKNLPLINL
ncbi:MAG: 1-aminocyclopropane-1-carboxylate deaminase/D-cysteine desulfhydrase [Flavobacteriaceae bacterium]